MNDFTKDIGKSLLSVLWYLSNYTYFDEYGNTTRRDFIELAIGKIEPHLANHKEEIEHIFSEFKNSFNGHPYHERATLFADDFLKVIKNKEDAVILFINGEELRKNFPYQGKK
jgi:hypothetical protein